ncbi:MAG: NAD-dependent epimerase/dehydratase family protein [Labilithrix sp.]|nr:NAD-dependent epimerase/dehydratase family protein [Labilithrix sp.]
MTVLVTGGAGFIGANVVDRLLQGGERVRILDDLSRPGVEKNLQWLDERHHGRFELMRADVRDPAVVRDAVNDTTHVFHFAAQVATPASLFEPIADFAINARGTLNLLEAIRAQPSRPSLIYTSSSKVYGTLADLPLRAGPLRYEPRDIVLAATGVDEKRPLAFHGPHGCSKGAADQYVLDYAHTFGLRAVVFRLSCVYGPRQRGHEDQGWVSHFLTHALRREPITIFGDGKQVRDLLYIDDLVDAFWRVRGDIARLAGRAFNVGGGPTNTVSLLELLGYIDRMLGRAPRVGFEPARIADPRYYVSAGGALSHATGWHARTTVEEGLARLLDWLRQQPENGARKTLEMGVIP